MGQRETKRKLEQSIREKEAIERERNALECRNTLSERIQKKQEEDFDKTVEEVSLITEIAPSIVKKVLVEYTKIMRIS